MTVHALGCLSLAEDLCAAASTVSRAGDRGRRLLKATTAANVAPEAGQKEKATYCGSLRVGSGHA